MDVLSVSQTGGSSDVQSVWRVVDNVQLSVEDHRILLDPAAWLTDRHIHAAQQLLRRQFPHVGGLEDPLLLNEPRYSSDSEMWRQLSLQIHNVRGNHWLVSSFNSETNEVCVS